MSPFSHLNAEATPPAAEPPRYSLERVVLAMALPAVAGAVNASGFHVVGAYTSHATGHVARIGDAIAEGRYGLAVTSFGLVVSFLLGAMLATMLIERARRRGRRLYYAALLVEAVVLAGFATWMGLLGGNAQHLSVVALLCIAMGMQNALVTKVSGAGVRTTHLTGILTDIGIESVRLGVWLRDQIATASLGEAIAIPKRFYDAPEWRKLRLHLMIVLSFLVGTIVGPQLFTHYGQAAMIAPCVVLLGLAVFDIVRGIH